MLINFISNFLALIGPDDGDTSRWIMMWTDEVSTQVVVTITSSTTTSSKIKRREMEVGTLLKKRLIRSRDLEKALIAIFGYVYNVEKQKLISRIMEALELC